MDEIRATNSNIQLILQHDALANPDSYEESEQPLVQY
jgi:hypothetical protein